MSIHEAMTLLAHNQLFTDDSSNGSAVASCSAVAVKDQQQTSHFIKRSMMVQFMRRHTVKIAFDIVEEDQFAVAVTKIAGNEDKLEGMPQIKNISNLLYVLPAFL